MKNNLVTPIGWDRELRIVSMHFNSDYMRDIGTAVLTDNVEWYSADIDNQTGEVSGVNAYADKSEAMHDAFKRIGLN